MLKEIRIKNLYGKPFKRDWLAKIVFPHTSPSNFRRPPQSLLLRHTAENLQVT